jgi:hypothetical protein
MVQINFKSHRPGRMGILEGSVIDFDCQTSPKLPEVAQESTKNGFRGQPIPGAIPLPPSLKHRAIAAL